MSSTIQTKLYKAHGRISAFDADQIREVLSKLEGGLRNPGGNYTNDLAQCQIDEIKKDWPEVHKQFLRTRIQVLSKGQRPNQEIFRRAVEETLAESIAQQRAQSRHTNVEAEAKIAAADLSLSMIFKRAPYAGESQLIRDYGGIKILSRTMTADGRIIIRCDDIAGADVLVVGFYDALLNRSMLIGWAKKSDVLTWTRGNKVTDPDNCNWTTMSYHAPLTQLRPMGDFLRERDIKQIPEGVLFEMLPNYTDLPVPARTQMEQFITSAEAAAKEFSDILGFDITGQSEEKPAEAGLVNPNAAKKYVIPINEKNEDYAL